MNRRSPFRFRLAVLSLVLIGFVDVATASEGHEFRELDSHADSVESLDHGDPREARESGSRGEHSERAGGERDAGDGKRVIDLARDERVDIGERIAVERDREGRERVPGEVVLIGSRDAVAAIRAAGYVLRAERPVAESEDRVARVQVAPGQSVERTLQRLQALAPSASLAPNHVYRPSQGSVAPVPSDTPIPAALSNPRSIAADPDVRLLGLIDTGAEVTALPQAVVRTRGFAGQAYTARAHGTLVAEIAAASGSRLAVADVFGADAESRLAAPADAIASAIAWLIAEQVRVINISIEGPDNAVMARLIRRAVEAGIVVVAAAGNDGPAAPPVYPAAYPGVIAVTAIDDRDQVYRRANRGAYIAFAAPGVNIVSTTGSFDRQPVSGTSFAAPTVAAMLAQRLAANRSLDAAGAVAALQREARDLGAPGRDPVYGWGALGGRATAAR